MFQRFAFGRCARYAAGLLSKTVPTSPNQPAAVPVISRMLCTGRTPFLSSSSHQQQRASNQPHLWQGVSAHSYSRGLHTSPLTPQHSPMASIQLGNARSSKVPGRPMLPLQAAGGGGAGGSSGSKKGYSSGDSSSGSGSGGLWESYNKLLEQYPLLIKAITTALLSAVGNLICQFLVEGKSELDWRRFNTFTALGFVWVAPCLHFWFGALNRMVTNPGNVGALMRMALDQLGFAPVFISSMIAILAGLDGKSLDQCVAVVKRDLPDAIRANWILWVPAQFINFRFVPATYQVLFANMVALLWNVYFSFATRPKTA